MSGWIYIYISAIMCQLTAWSHIDSFKQYSHWEYCGVSVAVSPVVLSRHIPTVSTHRRARVQAPAVL